MSWSFCVQLFVPDIPHSEEEIHGDLEEEDFWATVDLISDIVADMAVSIIFIFFTLRIFALINIMANHFFPIVDNNAPLHNITLRL